MDRNQGDGRERWMINAMEQNSAALRWGTDGVGGLRMVSGGKTVANAGR